MRSKVEMMQKQKEILSSREVRSTEVQEKFAKKGYECLCLTEELSNAKEERPSQAEQKLDENQRTIANNQQVSCQIHQLFSNLILSLFLMLV